jgi:signal transduction histidine kinase
VLAVALAAWASTIGSGYADIGGAALVALYSAGRYASNDRRAHLGVGAAIAVVVLDNLTDPAPWGDAVIGAVAMFVAWYVGRRLRLRSERADQLRREQAAEARRIVVEERARIARELHDVVAHQLTLINAQAGVALYLHEGGQSEPARLAETLSHVKDDSKQALAELRSIVGLLGAPEVPREPVPGLDRLDDLAASFARAGLTVEVRRQGETRAVPSAVDVSGYRIVQEALTNVSKHAATATARVSLDYAPDTLKIVIADDGAGQGSGGGSGRGLIGMRERAAAVGGEVTAGHRPGGGFLVEAALPLGDQ